MRRLLALQMIGLFALSSTASMCSSQTTTADIQRENAIAFEQEGDNIGAESAWRAFLMSHPANSEAYAHLGLLEARQEHYAQAVPLYRKALALDPKMPGLNLNLGLSLFKSGALKEAVRIFSAILDHQSLTPSETQRLDVLIGMSHYGLGEFAAAVPYLKTAASVDRQSLWIRLTLAQSCLRSKLFPCVLEVYREILALNAESAEADMLAGEALDEMRDHAGAIEQFAAAAKVDPKMPNVHFALGYVLWTQNRLEEAAKEFTAELANTPDHPQALTYLADVDIKLDDLTTAQPLLEGAIRSDPRIELAHLDLGIIYANRGRKIEALREMKTAEQQNPNDQNVHWRLARFYKSMGNNEAAKVEFDKTRSVQKAADESISNKLQQAQDHGKTPSPDIDIPNR